MPGRHEIIWVEKYDVSSACVAAVVSYQGRQPYMEDRFRVITNINGSEVSIYSIFDGHAGEFAADYATDVIVPAIGEKIGHLLELIKLKNQKPTNTNEEKKLEEPEEVTEPEEINPLEVYIRPDKSINYEKLLHDEIISADKILVERMANATLFCGTTANIVVVDLESKLIVCANVGDSRALLCDSKGIAYALSKDHKPNNPDEMIRIRESGGSIVNKGGCWRVDGTLACSRSLGDYPLKQKKFIIATPDIKTFRFKDFQHLPKFIIIGSDGLFDVFGNKEICDFTKLKLKEPHYGARSLMKKAYARKSADNISVIVIKFIKPKPKKTPKANFDLTSNTYEWLK